LPRCAFRARIARAARPVRTLRALRCAFHRLTSVLISHWLLRKF